MTEDPSGPHPLVGCPGLVVDLPDPSVALAVDDHPLFLQAHDRLEQVVVEPQLLAQLAPHLITPPVTSSSEGIILVR
jgi:hypothetical protein